MTIYVGLGDVVTVVIATIVSVIVIAILVKVDIYVSEHLHLPDYLVGFLLSIVYGIALCGVLTKLYK